jgi:hypothetical protein
MQGPMDLNEDVVNVQHKELIVWSYHCHECPRVSAWSGNMSPKLTLARVWLSMEAGGLCMRFATTKVNEMMPPICPLSWISARYRERIDEGRRELYGNYMGGSDCKEIKAAPLQVLLR